MSVGHWVYSSPAGPEAAGKNEGYGVGRVGHHAPKWSSLPGIPRVVRDGSQVRLLPGELPYPTEDRRHVMDLFSYLQRQRVVRETAATRRIARRAEDRIMRQPQEAKVEIHVGDADPRVKVLRYGERSVIDVEVHSEDGRVGPFKIVLELKDIK